MTSRRNSIRLQQVTSSTSCQVQVAAFQRASGGLLARHQANSDSRTRQPRPSVGRMHSPHSPRIRLRLWPCNSACRSWQIGSVSLACASSSIRGFHRSRLRPSIAFPPFGFVPSQALLLSCVASHLQPKGQVLPLTSAASAQLSVAAACLCKYICTFSLILQSSHFTLSTLPRVLAHTLFLPCTSSKSSLQELTVRVAESTDL
jgi:hypothetical protein